MAKAQVKMACVRLNGIRDQLSRVTHRHSSILVPFTSKTASSTADQEKAAAWWQLAAEQEFVPAQFNLASLYCRGIGVSRDQDQCKFWYGQAASIGDAQAQIMLDSILASENALKADEETEKVAETEPVAGLKPSENTGLVTGCKLNRPRYDSCRGN